ncbi:MAG: histidinol-phosphate transaminase, partial [Nitrospinae bacterium]|nr:histidinol-phosphate transaminase [Nitrospinota bacterium]
MSNVDLLSLVRDKVKKLKAYKVENYDCDIKLHANENPFSPPAELMESFRKSLEDFKLNRYP